MSDKITGLMIYYYFVCKRKLWYFLNEIQLEKYDENIMIGKVIDENSYEDNEKHITINNEISIDFKNDKTLHEIKKSKKCEEAGIWQTKYYLYYLKKYGVKDINAEIDYPLLKKQTNIELSEEDEEILNKVIKEIQYLKTVKEPPVLEQKGICKKCAYYDFCNI